MKPSEREELMEENIHAIMPVIEQVYGNTPQWKRIFDIIYDIDLYGKQRNEDEQVIGYSDFYGKIHVTPLFYELGLKTQQMTLLHELAHSYVSLIKTNYDYHYPDPHEHPEFISKYSESLKLFGTPIKEPTGWKLEFTIYPPTELPPKGWIDEEEDFYHNYYCPVCQDVFNTTLEDFKKEHSHAFE
jgi:hypothetical protein